MAIIYSGQAPSLKRLAKGTGEGRGEFLSCVACVEMEKEAS